MKLATTAVIAFAISVPGSLTHGGTNELMKKVAAEQAGTDYWHARALHDERTITKLRRLIAPLRRENGRLRRIQQPTVSYALTLASHVFDVPRWQLDKVSRCESTYNPGARNGKYKGLFQLGWSPFGLSPYEPIASALSAAQTVRHDGSWRQWECKP